jgi:hypothetical protein
VGRMAELRSLSYHRHPAELGARAREPEGHRARRDLFRGLRGPQFHQGMARSQPLAPHAVRPRHDTASGPFGAPDLALAVHRGGVIRSSQRQAEGAVDSGNRSLTSS